MIDDCVGTCQGCLTIMCECFEHVMGNMEDCVVNAFLMCDDCSVMLHS